MCTLLDEECGEVVEVVCESWCRGLFLGRRLWVACSGSSVGQAVAGCGGRLSMTGGGFGGSRVCGG